MSQNACVTKNQFYFFFLFQKYVTELLNDRSFKLSFQKDIYFDWGLPNEGRPLLTLKSWENWIEDKLRVHS